MLLAETLNERADARRRLHDLTRRIAEGARVSAGQCPAEDPQKLLDQAIAASERLCALDIAITVTNVAATMSDGRTITEALALGSALRRRIRLVSDAADHASGVDRAGWTRDVAVLDVGALRVEADRLAAERSALTAALQRVGWSTPLRVAV